MAAERLGELGGLPVPDARRHVTDGQRAVLEQLQRALHPHLGHVGAKARPADLGEGALELAPRRREPARDLVELQILRVFPPDYFLRLLEERFSALRRPVSH
jgi:hypothetical protein